MKEKQLSNLKYVSESFGSNDHNDKKEEPTTTRKELSKIALKYEQIISERMRERQIENGRNQSGNLNNIESRPNEPLSIDKTSKRKELAKIANTSEGSIQRTTKRTTKATIKTLKINRIIKFEAQQTDQHFTQQNGQTFILKIALQCIKKNCR